MEAKRVYFASDLHLGLPDFERSLKREKLFVAWLDSIKSSAHSLYLVGDIFDFWFEYKKVAPRGFTRFLGKLCEFTDSGIPVYFFTGNHDMWIFDYIPSETGVKLIRKPIITEILGKKFYIGHGDGLGPGDYNYKFLKRFFNSRFMQWFFTRFHPNFSFFVAHKWSHGSRYSKGEPITYLGHDKEWLTQYAIELLKNEKFDFIVFGHRHLPHIFELEPGCTLVNLGDWIGNFTYGEFDGNTFLLKNYIQPTGEYIALQKK